MCLPCCSSNNYERGPSLAITAFSLVSITLVVLNVLAMQGYINAQTIGIVDTAFLGSVALLSIGYDRCGPLHRSDFERNLCLSIGLVLSILSALTSLGIFKIWGATTVAWIGIPVPAVLSVISVGALTCITHRHWKQEGYIAW